MSAVPKPRQPMRMMIVDDSNVMRRRIERSQQNDLLEVVGTAVNGLDAVHLGHRVRRAHHQYQA
jgi:chemotaxis response regulator CheB